VVHLSFEELMQKADESADEVAELCSSLVQFNSAHPTARTDHCVEYIKNYFDTYGIENEVHSCNDLKPNIVAKVGPSTGRKILWVGHLDVVPEGKPEMWKYPAYSGEVTDDGYVWGRGTSDMKGACAAAMVSARLLNEVENLKHRVEFWFTADEEIGGGDGARWLAQSGRLKGDVCIIGDGNGGGPNNPSIDMGCKGSLGTKLIAKGKTAHGSTPYLGDNAISKLIKVIPWVEKIGDYKLELPDELDEAVESSVRYYMGTQNLDTEEKMNDAKKLFNYPTVTCNIISGGVKNNVVPDYAEATFDIRLPPGSKTVKVKERIEELVKEAGVAGVSVEVRASETAGYYVSPYTNFSKQLASVVERVTEGNPVFKILTGGTDAIPIKKYTGIQCLGYGTSLIGMAHQPDERVTIENLVLGIKVYAGFALLY